MNRSNPVHRSRAGRWMRHPLGQHTRWLLTLSMGLSPALGLGPVASALGADADAPSLTQASQLSQDITLDQLSQLLRMQLAQGKRFDSQRVLAEARLAGMAHGQTSIALADVWADAGWYIEARDLLENAVEANPSDVEVRLALAQLLAELGELRACLDHVQIILNEQYFAPQHVNAWEIGCIALGAAQRYESLTRWLDEHDRFSDSVAWQAMTLIRQGQPDQALSLIAQSEPEQKSQVVLFNMIAALAAEKLGDQTQALNRLEHVCSLTPNRPIGLSLIAAWLDRQPHFSKDQTDALWERLEWFSPGLSAIVRAETLLRQGQAKQAHSLLDEALDQAIANEKPWVVELAQALAGVRQELDLDQPHEGFRRLAKSGWLPATATMAELDWWAGQSQNISAETWFGVHRLVTSEESFIYSDLARRLARQGEIDRAIEVLQAARQAGHHESGHIRTHAQLLAMHGQTSDAIFLLDQLKIQNPDHAGIAMQLAKTLKRSGRLGQAITAYEQAIQLDPITARQACLGLTQLNIDLQQHNDAMDVLKLAMKQPWADPGFQVQAARVAIALNQNTDAKHWLNQVRDGSAVSQLAEIELAWLTLGEETVSQNVDLAKVLLASKSSRSLAMSRWIALIEDLEDTASKDRKVRAIEFALGDDELTGEVAARWSMLRVRLAEQTSDWTRLERALVELERFGRESQRRWAGRLRVAVLMHLDEHDQAHGLAGVILENTANEKSIHDALRLATDQWPSHRRARGVITGLLEAMLSGDSSRVSLVLHALPASLTLHPHDVHEMLRQVSLKRGPIEFSLRQLAGAALALEAGSGRLCADMAKQVALETPENWLAHSLWAQGLIAAGEDATEVLQAIQRDAPDTILAQVVQGYQLQQSEQWEVSVSHLQQALRMDPGNEHITVLLAESLCQSLDERQWARGLRLLSGLHQSSTIYKERAASMLIQTMAKHRPSRLAMLDRLARTTFGEELPVEILRALGQASLSQQQPEKARDYFQDVVIQTPADYEAHDLLSQAYDQLGQTNMSLEHRGIALSLVETNTVSTTAVVDELE